MVFLWRGLSRKSRLLRPSVLLIDPDKPEHLKGREDEIRSIVQGKVTKITNFGVFVELEEGLEGLLHISELSDEKVENPQDVVKVDDILDVKILRVDIEERKIGLSLKRAKWSDAEQATAEEASESASTSPKRGGMDEHGALGTDKIEF